MSNLTWVNWLGIGLFALPFVVMALVLAYDKVLCTYQGLSGITRDDVIALIWVTVVLILVMWGRW